MPPVEGKLDGFFRLPYSFIFLLLFPDIGPEKLKDMILSRFKRDDATAENESPSKQGFDHFLPPLIVKVRNAIAAKGASNQNASQQCWRVVSRGTSFMGLDE
jgi:hypothetical protein